VRTVDLCQVLIASLHYCCNYVQMTKSAEMYSCADCEFSSKTLTDYMEHFACDHTDDKEYTSVGNKMVDFHQKILQNQFSCELCIFKTASTKSMRRHKLNVHQGCKYSCDACDFQASDRSSLNRHKKNIHEGK